MDICFPWEEPGIFVDKPTGKPKSFKRKLWAGQIQWEKNHHEILAASACSSGRGIDSLRKTTGWPWAPDMRIFTEDVAPGRVTVYGGRPPPPNMKSLKWQREQASGQLLQQDPEGAGPSEFAMQEVSAKKNMTLGTVVFLCRSLLGRAGGFTIRESCEGEREGQRGQQDGHTPWWVRISPWGKSWWIDRTTIWDYGGFFIRMNRFRSLRTHIVLTAI